MLKRRSQRTLLLLVVANDVLKPNQFQSFSKLMELSCKSSTHSDCSSRGWRRIKCHPTVRFAEVDFNPGVRVALSDRVCAGGLVVFTRQKTIHSASTNTARAQHHRHSCSKVLAMAGLHIKQEIRERIRTTGLHLE